MVLGTPATPDGLGELQNQPRNGLQTHPTWFGQVKAKNSKTPDDLKDLSRKTPGNLLRRKSSLVDR